MLAVGKQLTNLFKGATHNAFKANDAKRFVDQHGSHITADVTAVILVPAPGPGPTPAIILGTIFRLPAVVWVATLGTGRSLQEPFL